jgi:hypothetical protein
MSVSPQSSSGRDKDALAAFRLNRTLLAAASNEARMRGVSFSQLVRDAVSREIAP